MSRFTFTAFSFRSVPVRVAPGALLFMAAVVVTLGSQVLPASAPSVHPFTHWVVALLGAAVFAASLVAHELAHTTAALRARVPVEEVKLVFLGGMAKLCSTPRHAADELRIAIAGPAASATLAALFAVCALPLGNPATSAPAALFAWAAAMNLVIAAFNILPFAPLDGGRVLAALLWRRSGNRLGARLAAARVGVGVGGLSLVFAGVPSVLSASVSTPVLWVGFVGLFILVASTMEMSVYRVAASVEGRVAADLAVDPATLSVTPTEVVSADEPLDDVVLRSSGDAVAVVDAHGRPVGAVDLAALRTEVLRRH